MVRTYGFTGDDSGPVFAGATRERSALRVRFEHAWTGLIARDKPLQSFEVAGDDRVFYPATAAIEGDTLLVRAPRGAGAGGGALRLAERPPRPTSPTAPGCRPRPSAATPGEPRRGRYGDSGASHTSLKGCTSRDVGYTPCTRGWTRLTLEYTYSGSTGDSRASISSSRP
jgi:hypothetical protein